MHHTLLDAPSRARLGIAAAALGWWLAVLATTAAAAVPDPVVTGPIPSAATPGDPSHDYIFFASLLDLASMGYVEEEYFISGTANRYFIAGNLDGNRPRRRPPVRDSHRRPTTGLSRSTSTAS